MTQILDIDGLVNCTWSLMHRQTRQFSEDGKGQVYNFGEPYWVVGLEWIKKTPAQFRAVSALLQRLQGANDDIQLFNVTRQGPTNFNGNGAAITSISEDGSQNVTLVTIGNMGLGDFIAYDTTSGGRFVGEITEIGSTPDGNTTVFTTAPPAQPVHGTPNAEIWRAHGLFKLEPESLEISETIGAGPGVIKANFRQVSP